MLRRNLPDRLVSSERLQRHSSLELCREPVSYPHRLSLRQTVEYTLTPPRFSGTTSFTFAVLSQHHISDSDFLQNRDRTKKSYLYDAW